MEIPSGSGIRRTVGATIRNCLERRDFEGVLASASLRKVEKTLGTLLYERDEVIHWRALEAFGRLAASRAERDPAFVREIVRRMFWAMNDESGNSIFHAPEVIGEVLARVPSLAAEFSPILTGFMREEPFERGVHWAMSRIAEVRPEAFAPFTHELARSLSHPDPHVRGFSLSALSPEAAAGLAEEIRALTADEAVVRFYDFESGELRRKTVGEIARDRLAARG